jgi:hypothetical protein
MHGAKVKIMTMTYTYSYTGLFILCTSTRFSLKIGLLKPKQVEL